MSAQGNDEYLFTLDLPDPTEYSAQDLAFADSCLIFHDAPLNDQPFVENNNNNNVAPQPPPTEEWEWADLVMDINSLDDLFMPPVEKKETPFPANFPQPSPELPPVQPWPITNHQERKRKRWSMEEHELFLMGLKVYQRGDWKSISRHFVTTRSSIQIASHAQKYFLRLQRPNQSEATTKKRRSIHDLTTEHIPGHYYIY